MINTMNYVVYILECSDKTLYVGSTSHIEKRLYAHNHLKSGAHYTKIRRPVFLMYTERVEHIGIARRREAEMNNPALTGRSISCSERAELFHTQSFALSGLLFYPQAYAMGIHKTNCVRFDCTQKK